MSNRSRSFVVALALLAASTAGAQSTNRLLGMSEAVSGPPGVEVHVYSERPFPVGAMPPVLNLGGVQVMNSRNPEDGSLNHLIFFVSEEQFRAASDGGPMWVEIGPAGNPAHPRWDFGNVNKSQVRR